MKEPIKIATAQSFISRDVRRNGLEVRKLMRQASKEGSQLVHFAEVAISGYAKSQIKSWQEVDWHLLRQELALTAQLAGELGIWVVLGSNHQLSELNRPHNSLYVISSEGKLHTRYDKQWCSHSELSDWYTPGTNLCVFKIEGWRFGCALCIEIQFPELFLAYAAQNIDCLLLSTYSESGMFGIQAQAYAAAHTFWFSVAVPAQLSHTLSSRMIGPDGELQTVCKNNTSTVGISLLDARAERWQIPLKYAKPWRTAAREGSIYRSRLVDDVRSEDKTRF